MTTILTITAVITFNILLAICGIIYMCADRMWDCVKRVAKKQKDYLLGRVGERTW